MNNELSNTEILHFVLDISCNKIRFRSTSMGVHELMLDF
jgi:hypothetical protein